MLYFACCSPRPDQPPTHRPPPPNQAWTVSSPASISAWSPPPSSTKTRTAPSIVNTIPTAVNLHPGNTVGPLVTIRYTKSAYVGFEFNYAYARYTQTFTPFGSAPVGGVQQNASEYSFGYVAHFRRNFHGVAPFAGGGAGTTAFRPTPGGGEGLQPQARATYYYNIGGDYMLNKHFGARAEFRETFFKAPDFETNYLTIQKHTTEFQPGFGFFYRF